MGHGARVSTLEFRGSSFQGPALIPALVEAPPEDTPSLCAVFEELGSSQALFPRRGGLGRRRLRRNDGLWLQPHRSGCIPSRASDAYASDARTVLVV